MKRKKLVIFVVIAVYLVLSSFTYSSSSLGASNSDAEKDLNENIMDIVDNLDLAELEEYLASLSDEQLAVVADKGIKEKIKSVISGNLGNDYSSFFAYLADMLGVGVLRCMPLIVTVIAVAVAYNLLSSLRGRFASDSVQNIIYFACVSLITVILFAGVFSVISSVRSMIEGLQKQMDIFFPILLTLMAAVGAGSSVSVYKPSVAILASGISELVTALILPAFIISVVLSAVGNLSEGVKLGKLSDFFSSAAKWLLGSAFFLFTAFLGVQGITASVYDGVSVRTAKFALGKYVPIIGGYLSDGLNLVMSGSVLVKNAVGMTAIVLLLVSVAPVLLQILLLSLGLKLAGAVIEPLSDGRMSALVTSIGKSLTLLVSMVLAVAFLYFVFLVLIICTGNLAV